MTTQKISHDAAHLLRRQLAELDAKIDRELARIGAASATLVDARLNIKVWWDRRRPLAEELGRLAPDDFYPDGSTRDTMQAMAVSSGPNPHRFGRAHPFPFLPDDRSTMRGPRRINGMDIPGDPASDYAEASQTTRADERIEF